MVKPPTPEWRERKQRAHFSFPVEKKKRSTLRGSIKASYFLRRLFEIRRGWRAKWPNLVDESTKANNRWQIVMKATPTRQSTKSQQVVLQTAVDHCNIIRQTRII